MKKNIEFFIFIVFIAFILALFYFLLNQLFKDWKWPVENNFFQIVNVRSELGSVRLSSKNDKSTPDAEYEIYYWTKYLSKNVAKLDEATKLVIGSPQLSDDIPHLQIPIITSGKSWSTIVAGLTKSQWYTFAFKRVDEPSLKLSQVNFDTVYIHDGIKIIIAETLIDSDDYQLRGHAILVEEVVQNEATILFENCVDPCDWERFDELFFPLDQYETTVTISDTIDFSANVFDHSDIISVSLTLNPLLYAKNTFKKFINHFPLNNSEKIPLLVIAGGNEAGLSCTEHAWDQNVNSPSSPDVENQYKNDCALLPAHIVKQQPHYVEHLIIVGSSEKKFANKPGEVLKDRWISTHFNWKFSHQNSFLDWGITGTSFGTPYVAKIAAEIKRRVPHYTNAEIANLIFETAYDAGVLGTDPVYGRGILDPLAIFDELTVRGY